MASEAHAAVRTPETALVPPYGAEHPDAELFRLERAYWDARAKWDAAAKRVVAADRRYIEGKPAEPRDPVNRAAAYKAWAADVEAWRSECGLAEAEEMEEAAAGPYERAHLALISTPAKTMAGLLAKIGAHESYTEGVFEEPEDVEVIFADIKAVAKQMGEQA